MLRFCDLPCLECLQVSVAVVFCQPIHLISLTDLGQDIVLSLIAIGVSCL